MCVPLRLAIGVFPFPEWKKDGFWGQIKDLFAIFIIVAFMYPVSSMIRQLVIEKETKIKEGMKMMSLDNGALVTSWILHFGSTWWILSVVITFISRNLFTHSDPKVIFLYFFAFLNAQLSFCYWISTIFSRSKTAAIVGVMMYFSGYVLNEGVKSSRDWITIALASLHPVAAFTVGINGFVEYEDSMQGVTFYTWSETVQAHGFTFKDVVSALVFDVFFWAFMTWYFEKVMPSEWGTNEQPWFIINPWYWFGSCSKTYGNGSDARKALNELRGDGSGHYVEGVSDELMGTLKEGKGIFIQDLRKSFNTTAGIKHAVDGLNLNIFHNQITCLLGHNGAGKTTTMGMLTGLINASSGTASVDGKDVFTEMAEIRKDLGVCPQHDILWPDLTVREHLRLFAVFKGVASNLIEAQVTHMIKEVGLVEKADSYSKDLSGGMKRKLSVGIAFIGGSNVVLLDEPTSGMDPYSRRFTWNVIRNMREDRTIILTTHFMDEADLLGDRIAIMAEGKLRCAGSSLYLKSQFGVGYTLAIEKGPGFNDRTVKGLVSKYVPENNEISNVGTEIVMQLPLNASENFQSLFEQFDDRKKELNIVNYGVSVTTLEEVFIKVAHGGDHDKQENEKVKRRLSVRRSMSGGSSFSKEAILPGEVQNDEFDAQNSNQGFEMTQSVDGEDDTKTTSALIPMKINTNRNLAYFGRHMYALFFKRAVYFTRDKKAWFFSFALPLIFVWGGLFIMKATASNYNQPSLEMSMKMFEQSGTNPVPYGVATDDNFRCNNDPNGGHVSNCTVEGTDLFMEKMSYCDESEAALRSGANLKDMSNWLLESTSTLKASRYGAVVVTGSAGNTPLVVDSDDVTSLLNANILLDLNASAYHAAPVLITSVYESLLKMVDPDVTFTASSYPMPQTLRQAAVGEGFTAIFPILMILLGFPFIPSAFIMFVVKEKENKSKHIQLVSGVSPHAFWLSTWIWDSISYQLPMWGTIALLKIYEIDSLTDDNTLGTVIKLFVGYGPAMAGLCYCMSFGFMSHSKAQISIIFFSFVTGLIMGMASIIMTLLSMPVCQEDDEGNSFDCKAGAVGRTKDMLMPFFRFVPGFNLAHGLLAITFNHPPLAVLTLVDNIDPSAEGGFKPSWDGKPYPPDHPMIAGDDIQALLIESFAYVFLAIVIEYIVATPSLFAWITQWMNPAPQVDFDIDDDVANENERLREAASKLSMGDDSAAEAITVCDFKKVYSSGPKKEDGGVKGGGCKVCCCFGPVCCKCAVPTLPGCGNGKYAVKGVSVGVPYGMCFGLLGINGAGKTTTLSMLSGEFPPSSGRAWLAGKDILTRASEVRRLIGYCPQFDALFELMTGEEHLRMYARIKGIEESSIEACVQEQIKRMDLQDHCKRMAGGYSGGNKRKLSVACAMIGQPSIIFLDEPSTGMDPVARRFMWSVINDICAEGKTSVILTTHSMEECEALCQKIGIMVGGRFRCIGSGQHLKNKFGLGYQLECVLKAENAEHVEEWMGKLGAGKTTDLNRMDMTSMLNNAGIGEWAQALTGMHEVHDGCSLHDFAVWCCQEDSFRKLIGFMNTTYPGSVMREWQGSKVRFEVPNEVNINGGLTKIKLSSMFGTLTKAKDTLNLQEYSLSQTSLEQIFNMFAGDQEEEAGNVVSGTAVNNGNKESMV